MKVTTTSRQELEDYSRGSSIILRLISSSGSSSSSTSRIFILILTLSSIRSIRLNPLRITHLPQEPRNGWAATSTS